MKSRILLPVVLLLFSACTGKKESALENHNRAETLEIIPPLPSLVHNSVSISRNFSSATSKDKFSLSIHGVNYLDAEVCFAIRSFSGDTLFFRKTTGRGFLGGIEPGRIKTEEQRMQIIRERMSTFFAETGFSNPPYSLNDPIKSGLKGDQQLWSEIENDSSSWCFEFSLMENGATEVIGYSRSRDTILVYDVIQ